MKQIIILIAVMFLGCDLLNNGLDSGNLPNPNTLRNAKDSLFVRALLDSNGLTSTPASKVMDIASNSIIRIYISPKDSILILPAIIDSLPSDITIGAKGIDSLLVLVKLHNPIRLHINNNNFKTFPIDAFNLAENSSIDISVNKITSLPVQIMTFKFKYFWFMNNQICSPTDSIKSWLTKWDPNWEKYQSCP